jgi:hypothetical protein
MNTSIAANGTKTTKEDTLSGKSFGVTGLYHFNPQGSYSPFVKLGWHHWSFKNQESESGNHEFYGVGLDGKINETIKYRVEPERMNIGSIDKLVYCPSIDQLLFKRIPINAFQLFFLYSEVSSSSLALIFD